MKYEVYNLEFPLNRDEIEIFGYKFKKVCDYNERVQELQQLVDTNRINRNVGKHTVTATVEIPANEKKSVFTWKHENPTALDDILLLLSLFTRRDVFLNKDDNEFYYDPRYFKFGATLICSLPQEFNDYRKIDEYGYTRYIGFEKGLNEIYKLIRTDEWINKYAKGFFLLLLRAAYRRQTLEPSFILCYTIWEHLYWILKRNKYICNKDTIGSGEKKKIASLFYNFDFLDNKNDCIKSSEIFYETRKNLVHSGRFLDLEKGDPKIYYLYGPKHHKPEYLHDKSMDDAILFIHLTETITAKILGLKVDDLFSSLKKIRERLEEKLEFKKIKGIQCSPNSNNGMISVMSTPGNGRSAPGAR